jgi:hypothetical protein
VLIQLDKYDWTGHVHEGSYRMLKELCERLSAIQVIPGAEEETEIPKKLRATIVRCLERLVYGVTHTYVYMWDHKGGDRKKPLTIRRFPMWMGTRHDGTLTNVKPPPEVIRDELYSAEIIYRRPYFMQRTKRDKTQEKEVLTGDPVWHIEVPVTRHKKANKKSLKKLSMQMRKLGWTFIGCKAKSMRPIAVFGKGKTLQGALTRICGQKIANEIMRGNKMKKIQNLVVMLCRVGWGARHEVENDDWIATFDPVILKGPEYDGLLLTADKELSDCIRDLFMMPDDTKVCAGSYLGEAWAKGLIMLDQPKNSVGLESVKLGKWGRDLDLSKLIIHEMDSLALSHTKKEKISIDETFDDTQELAIERGKSFYAGLNLGQEWVYCFTPKEQEKLLDWVFIRQVSLAGNLENKFHSVKSVDRLMAMGVTVDDIKEDKIKDRIRTWTLQTALNAPIPGMYVIFAPNMPWDKKLGKFEIRVPKKAKKNGIKKGDKVCVTRHPMLPVGNGTQVFTVVGFTDGNYAQVTCTPWTTIMGGDFDGDLGRISKWLYDFFPDKQWDQTPMSEIEPQKMDRTGARSLDSRLDQATMVVVDEIGKYDFAARKAWELGNLTPGIRLLLSKQIQANIMGQKHDVVVHDLSHELREITPPRINGVKTQYATGVVKNAVNEPRARLLRATEHLPYHRLFVHCYNLVDQELPKKHLDKGKLKGLADQIPDSTVFSKAEWLKLRKIGRDAALTAKQQFEKLWLTYQPDLEYMILADKLSVHLMVKAARIAETPLETKDLTELKKHEIRTKARRRAAHKYLMLQLGAMCKWRIICRLSLPGWEELARSASS